MVNNTQKFSAHWSIIVWIITIIIGLIVFVVVPVRVFSFVVSEEINETAKFYLFMIALVPTIFLVAILFAPQRYTITNSEVIVNRLGPNIVIPISCISDVKQIQRKEVGFAIRLFGSRGFCGAYGTFYSFRLGLFKGYITNSKTLVFIKHNNGKKILLSPDRPDEFVAAVTQLQDRRKSQHSRITLDIPNYETRCGS
jgi:hypothetical protein